MPYSLDKLEKAVNALVKKGHDEAKIYHAVLYMKDFKDLSSVDLQTIKVDIADMLKVHENFEEIQEILNCRILCLQDQKSQIVAYNPVTHVTSRPKVYADLCKILDAELLNARLKMAYSEYNPRRMEKIYEDPDTGETIFNRYKPPKWLWEHFFNGTAIERRPIPPVYEQFFLHLVDQDSESYNFLLNWVSYSLKGRNNTMLGAIGTQGIGKGVLASIVGALHGVKEGNGHPSAPGTKFSSQFNAVVDGKTFVEFSEITLKTPAEINNWKQLANEDLDIEKKGIDPKSIKNHGNFFITANNMSAVKVASDDRRLSLLNLTETPLVEVVDRFGYKTAKQMANHITQDPSLIADLGSFLWHFEVDESLISTPFASKALERQRKASLLDWQKEFLASYCKQHAGESVKLVDVTPVLDNQLNTRLKLTARSFEELQATIKPLLKTQKGKSMFKMKRVKQADLSRPTILEIAEIENQPDEKFLDNFEAREEH